MFTLIVGAHSARPQLDTEPQTRGIDMPASPKFGHNASGFIMIQDTEECSLLGDSFGYIVQTVLGIIAFSTLILKRYREPEHLRRSWETWLADSSKQAFGALVAHFANVFISTGLAALAKQHGESNECLFYLVNFLADCLCGLLFNILLLRLVTHFATKHVHNDYIASGFYGEPFKFTKWCAQLGVWTGVIIMSKILVTIVFVLPLKSPMYRIADVLFRPLRPFPQIQLILVMIVIPLVLNAITFWIQDQYLMRPLEEAPRHGGGLWSADNFDDRPDPDVLATARRLHAYAKDPNEIEPFVKRTIDRPRGFGFKLEEL